MDRLRGSRFFVSWLRFFMKRFHLLSFAFLVLLTSILHADEKKIYVCYRSFWPELQTTKEFGEMGINTRCFFAANAINSAGFEYCKYPLIWTGRNKYDWAAFEQQVDDLLGANPNAEFLCMIDYNTPYWLTRKYAADSFSEITHFAGNKEWRDFTQVWVDAFIEHAEAKYGEKIVGYILSGGGTSEWYEYDRGRSSRIKNAAWRQWYTKNGFTDFHPDVPPETELSKASFENVLYDPATENEKIEYWRFHNEVVADALVEFAKKAREKIPAHKEIGVFFGYFFVSDSKEVSFGHLAYDRVFASPDIDFIISPGTYQDRQMGGGSGPQMVLGTAIRYGKRYMHEIDHRSSAVSGGNGWKTVAEDVAGLKREAMFALVNHQSLWWFDMWGRWFNAPEVRAAIARLKEISDRYIDDRSPSNAEILLLADPESMYGFNEKMPHASACAHRFRDKLNKLGTNYDVYSFNDVPFIDLSRYKVVFLPATMCITPEKEAVLKQFLCTPGRTLVWTYAPGISDGKTLDVERVKRWAGVPYHTEGPSVTPMEGGWTAVYTWEYKTWTPETLKQLVRDAGVHLYTEGPEPVFCNGRLLVIHTKDGGKMRVSLPKKYAQVVDVYHDRVVAEDADSFEYDFQTPDTGIFELK